jgi:mycofactocin precursor
MLDTAMAGAQTPAEGAAATLIQPPPAPAPEPSAADGLVEEELLVEDVSIDGMCGVY